ncbi:MAG: aldo/keto reductase [Solirubrobacteraceae bacterium]
MEYRQLGASGLRVSALSLGTMTFGGRGRFAMVGETDARAASRQLDMVLDAGVNLIDTADVYSDGVSEEILGEALAGRRDRLLIASKARFPLSGAGPNDAGLSRHHLIRSAEASLRRLKVDHIDLYQVHSWDGLTPLEETARALDELVRSGKVRYLGCSNHSGWHLLKALGVQRALGVHPYVSEQIYYSLAERSVEYELIPAAIDQGLGVLVWSPLAGGLLSGKYRRRQDPPEGARQLTDWGEPPVYDQEGLYDTVEVIVEVAEAHGVSASQVALAWLLGRPAVSSVIVGARTEEQLADNLAAASLQLSPDERRRLDAVSAPPLIYPYWHQRNTTSDRLGLADATLLAPRTD